jgi:membrane-anchored protein YejM (alkaline phosphatase superfamily)
MNVLEYINWQKGFQGRVAIFSSWERFPQILNMNRSGLLVNSGYADFIDIKSSDRLKYINRFQHEVPKLLGDSTRLDFLTYEMANEYFKEYKPRVMYLSFDETDDFAHEGHYDMYLKAAHQEDAFLKELWEKIQLDPQYKDKTTLLITCDHGRGTGDATKDRWTDHGTETPKSVQTWFAVIGPDSPSLREVKNTTTTYHKQLAQTMSKLLGLDFKSAAGHEVGDPVSTVFKP